MQSLKCVASLHKIFWFLRWSKWILSFIIRSLNFVSSLHKTFQCLHLSKILVPWLPELLITFSGFFFFSSPTFIPLLFQAKSVNALAWSVLPQFHPIALSYPCFLILNILPQRSLFWLLNLNFNLQTVLGNFLCTSIITGFIYLS